MGTESKLPCFECPLPCLRVLWSGTCCSKPMTDSFKWEDHNWLFSRGGQQNGKDKQLGEMEPFSPASRALYGTGTDLKPLTSFSEISWIFPLSLS